MGATPSKKNAPSREIPPPSAVGAPLGAAGATLFGTVARLRHDRAVHARGWAFRAVVETADPRLAAAGDEAVVRLSRGAGLPAAMPDVGGIAIRFSPGTPSQLDLLVATSTTLPVRYQAPVPRRRVEGATFTSIAPYELDGERVRLDAQVSGARTFDGIPDARPGQLRIELGARSRRALRPLATVRLEERLLDDEADQLRFSPVDAQPWLRPVGLLHAIRPPAYTASRGAAPPP